jgi:hypothetical protein
MTLTIEIKTLPVALNGITAITVLFSKTPDWSKQRTGKSFKVSGDTDVLEDSRIERGHPLFESRMADIRSMMQRNMIKEVRKMQGKALGLWPYKIELEPQIWDQL